MSGLQFTCVLLAGSMACCLIMGPMENLLIDEYWQDQIVKHGAAEYYLDQNYHRQWRWKDGK